MIIKNEEKKQEINLDELPFEILKDYVLREVDKSDILEYFDIENFQENLSTEEVIEIIYNSLGYFNTSEINEISKEIAFYSKDRILPNNNLMDQFKADFIINNWDKLSLNMLEGLLNE